MAWTAGPLVVLMSLMCVEVRSMLRAISPLGASISLAQRDLPGPPVQELDGIAAMLSSFIVSGNVPVPT